MTTQDNLVLDVWFDEAGDPKNYRFRIANPKANLQASEVRRCADDLVRSHALDFNGSGAPVSVVKAHAVTQHRQVMIQK